MLSLLYTPEKLHGNNYGNQKKWSAKSTLSRVPILGFQVPFLCRNTSPLFQQSQFPKKCNKWYDFLLKWTKYTNPSVVHKIIDFDLSTQRLSSTIPKMVSACLSCFSGKPIVAIWSSLKMGYNWSHPKANCHSVSYHLMANYWSIPHFEGNPGLQIEAQHYINKIS